MKKLITSASLAALGVASLQALPLMSSTETTKPWSVSAALRGFYDDNYATLPSDHSRSSFGFELAPSAGINLFREQTTIGLAYKYSFRYYDDRPDHKADHTHEVNAKISHAFTPRLKVDLTDSFVYAQEPTLIDPAVVTAPLRNNFSAYRNVGQASVSADITDRLGAVFGYTNTYYDYEETGPGSLSSLLDRMEHLGMANLRFTIVPSTIGVVGYQYGVVDYTSPGRLSVLTTIRGDQRGSDSHYGYLGVDHTFNHQLNGSVRVGVQYTEYDNPAVVGREDDVSPYADANMTYTYQPGSAIQLGVRHAKNPTDVGYIDPSGFSNATLPTVDAESTTVYASVSYAITPEFVASAIGQFQHSEFNGGNANNLADDYLIGGLQLTYQFNKFLAAETGYNYDRLDSDLHRIGVARSFTRNRVYIGIRATY